MIPSADTARKPEPTDTVPSVSVVVSLIVTFDEPLLARFTTPRNSLASLRLISPEPPSKDAVPFTTKAPVWLIPEALMSRLPLSVNAPRVSGATGL